ncbi:MAG TPA: dephospho-CoA kinase [Pyrinomonadaceae bacterium]
MLRVGLTGSIAVGKSFVLGVFRELGCFVLDADQVARDVVAPGTDGLRRIANEFGDEVLQPTGQLDRSKLGSIVFADEQKRLLLNSIVHPLVFQEQEQWLRECEAEKPDGIAIVDAALMIESGGYKRYDQLIVVWCEPDLQLKRLMSRDNLSRADAERRIASQMPQEEKKKFADHLIDTSYGFEVTRERTTEVFHRLQQSPKS